MSKIKITFEADSIEEAQNILNNLNTTSSPSLPSIENKFAGGPKDIPVDQLYNHIAAAENKPTIPTAVISPPPVPSETDTNNLPWDERIHSSSKTKTAKGVWTRRKNITNDLVAKVETELRAASTPQIALVNGPTPFMPVAATIIETPKQTYRAGDSLMPPPVPAALAPNTFQTLMNTISGLFASQGITPEYMKTLMENIGKGFNTPINAITDIATRQDMVDYAFVILKHDGKIA